jgi:hypothetical protein
MSLSRGSELADKVWAIVRPHLDPYKRQGIAEDFVEAFEELNVDPLWGPELDGDLKTAPQDIEDDWTPDYSIFADDDDDDFLDDDFDDDDFLDDFDDDFDDDDFDNDTFEGGDNENRRDQDQDDSR